MQTLFPLTIASSGTFPVTPFSAVTEVSPPLFMTSTGAARISSSREAPPSASRRTPFKPPATAHPFLRLPFLSCSHMPGGKTLMHQYQELITKSLTLGLKATREKKRIVGMGKGLKKPAEIARRVHRLTDLAKKTPPLAWNSVPSSWLQVLHHPIEVTPLLLPQAHLLALIDLLSSPTAAQCSSGWHASQSFLQLCPCISIYTLLPAPMHPQILNTNQQETFQSQ